MLTCAIPLLDLTHPNPLLTRSLCAEIIRGVGGVLLKGSGHRFVDELETRKHVVSKMNATGEKTFVIALPSGAAE